MVSVTRNGHIFHSEQKGTQYTCTYSPKLGRNLHVSTFLQPCNQFPPRCFSVLADPSAQGVHEGMGLSVWPTTAMVGINPLQDRVLEPQHQSQHLPAGVVKVILGQQFHNFTEITARQLPCQDSKITQQQKKEKWTMNATRKLS